MNNSFATIGEKDALIFKDIILEKSTHQITPPDILDQNKLSIK